MKGSFHIIVQNRYLKYEFDIRRNLTIIQGNSATGKTTLVDMIREVHMSEKSGVNLSCERPCRVLEGDLWRQQISYISDSILFIDEGASFVETEEFAEAVGNSSNYFVIVTRENLEMLLVSVEEVYGIRSSGKYGTLSPVYHEMYRIYDFSDEPAESLPVIPEELLTEDSNSGYEFFKNVAVKMQIPCSSACGKSNIFNRLAERSGNKELVVIADGAAFASQMNRLREILSRNKHIHLYLPESFEWLLLKSGIVREGEVTEILENPSEHIESAEYVSWERYFTSLITDKTRGTYLQYSKHKLNVNYLQGNITKRVAAEIKGVKLSP